MPDVVFLSAKMFLCFMLSLLQSSCFFFCKQKTAYEMRISDWSSDVCSSDLLCRCRINLHALDKHRLRIETFVRHVQRDNIAGLDPDPLRPGGEADRPRFPAVDNVVSGKLASLNRTRFAGEALHQLI